MENRDTKNSDQVDSKTSITRCVDSNSVNYNSIGSRFSYLRSNSLETVYAFDNPSFLPDGLPSSVPGENGIPPLPNILENNTYYDPHDFGKEHQATSFWGTVFHVFIVSAGPAVFTLPQNYLNVGLPIGVVGSILIICFYAYNMHMFADAEYEICKRKRLPNLSYSDTVYYAFRSGPVSVQFLAPYCRFLTYIMFAVLWTGAAAFSLVLIGENVQTIYTVLYAEEIDVRTAILLSIIPLLLLCWIPNLKHLVALSTAANVLTLFLIAVTVVLILTDSKPFHPAQPNVNLKDIPLFLGSILFCINATGILMPLKNDMKHPKKFASSFGVINVSYIPIALLLTFFGTLCAQKYGTGIETNLLANLPEEHYISKLIVPSFLLVLCFQFPFITYVVYDIIWVNILREKRKTMRHKSFSKYTVRTAIVAVVLLMTITVPNIPVFLSISGTVGTPMDSMLFPAIVNTLVYFRKNDNACKYKMIVCKNALIVVFALILIVFGMKDCINHISDFYDASSRQ